MTERKTPEALEGMILDPDMEDDPYWPEDADLDPDPEDELEDD